MPFKPDVIPVVDESLDRSPGIVERQRDARPDAFLLERAVPTFELSVGQSRQLHLICRMMSEPLW